MFRWGRSLADDATTTLEEKHNDYYFYSIK